MKTPMQEMVKWLDNIIAVIPDQSVGVKNQMIIAKLKAESLLEKEKEVIVGAYIDGLDLEEYEVYSKQQAEQYYNEKFNTKEK